MANEIDELIIKAKVEVDTAKLKSVKDDLEKFREKFKNNAIKLGFSEGQISQKLSGITSESKSATEIVKTLKDNNKIFEGVLKNTKATTKTEDDLFKLQKKEAERKKKADEDEKKAQGELKSDFVKSFASLNPKQVATGGVAAGAGALFGSGGGMATGLIVGAIIEAIKTLLDMSAKLVDDKLTKDIQLEKFSIITGKTTDALYKLDVKANLAGGSLESLVEGQQKFVDELLGGISAEKAQMFSMMGVNLKEDWMKSGGDPEKMRQILFESVQAATKNQPDSMRAGYLRQAGFSTDEILTRSHMNDSRINAETNNVMKQAGHISTPAESLAQRIQFRGKQREIEATKYGAANTSEAMSAALAALEMQAKIVKITTGLVQVFGKTIETVDKVQQAGRSSKVGKYFQGVGDNIDKMRSELNHPSFQQKTPTSSNSAVSATQNKG